MRTGVMTLLAAGLLAVAGPAGAQQQSGLPPQAQAAVLFERIRAILANETLPEEERAKQAFPLFQDYSKFPREATDPTVLAVAVEAIFPFGEYAWPKRWAEEFFQRATPSHPRYTRIAAVYAEIQAKAEQQEADDKLNEDKCFGKQGPDNILDGCDYIIDQRGWRWGTPYLADALVRRARARPGRDEGALEDLQNAVLLDPKNVFARYLLAQRRMDFDQSQAALEASIADFERALADEGKRNALIVTRYAQLLYTYRQADPTYLQRAFDLASESLRLPWPDKTYGITSTRDPAAARIDLLWLRGQAARELGDYPQAVRDFSEIITAQGGPEKRFYPGMTHSQRAATYLLMGNTAAADRDMAVVTGVATGDSPNPAEELSVQAQIYLLAKDYEKAEAAFTSIIADPPYATFIPASACRMHASWGGMNEKGLFYCNTAITASSGSHESLLWRGAIHARMGRWADALADFNQALKLNPGYALAQYGRGVAHLKLGRPAEGRRDIAAAVSADARIAGQARELGLGE